MSDIKHRNDEAPKCPHCGSAQTEGTAADYVTSDPKNYGNPHFEECEWCAKDMMFYRVDADTVAVSKA